MIAGTRNSKLAIAQTRIFMDVMKKYHPNVEISIKEIMTTGDMDQISDLSDMEGYGAFVRELDSALIRNDIDVSVNSMKDVPVIRDEKVSIAAVLPRASAEDVILPVGLDELPEGSVVGSSSVRRAAALRHFRPDLKVKPLRGNVNTRLDRLDRGEYDAIILAKAGLERLGIKRKMVPLSVNEFVPAPAQGAIAIACRSFDTETMELMAEIDDPAARRETDTERRLMRMMGGVCSSPIGIHARVSGSGMHLTASFFNGREMRFFDSIIDENDEEDMIRIVTELKGEGK